MPKAAPAAERDEAPGRLRLEYRRLDSLVPYAQNARRHSATQIDKIKASLVEFGWANPMLIAESQMIAGHGRLEAALALAADGVTIRGSVDGMAPTIDLSHLTLHQRRAYVLADNRLAEEASWDPNILRIEVAELQAANFDVTVAGFTDGELLTLIHGWSPDADLNNRVRPENTDLLAVLYVRCRRTEADELAAWLRTVLDGSERQHVTVARHG